MNSKKKFVLTIVITVLVTCMLTNVTRDIIYYNTEGRAMQKISIVKKMLSKYSLFDIDEDTVADYGAMAVSAAVGDPYTAYYPKDDFSSYKDEIMSSYVGIGATLGADTTKNKLIVISPMEDSPAEKAGIKSGDEIVSIDGKHYEANEITDAANYLKRGEAGTKVTLRIKREGKDETDIEVERAKVIKKSVKSKMLENNIGYIRITAFESNPRGDSETESTDSEFVKSLEALKTAGMTSLVLDLRDNPGGDVNVVCNIADKLLPEGIITYTEDKNGRRHNMNSDKEELDVPMAVLVNGGSASASEILTGALKDYSKATIIGTKTYGKGIVQTVFPFSDGSGMSITTARYFTPNGECIHKIGIEPDIKIEMSSDKAIQELSPEEDIQLQKAIEVLKK
ncbi:MAG: S41 family peptidase [Firmicutes bacterium]|nr:S41 family peptidase [Bacillota bacterium]